MTEPAIHLELAAPRYLPGAELAGVFVIPGGPPEDTRSVELSVLWRTSGKGTEDFGVTFYQAWKAEDGTLATLPNPNTFTVKLPQTPWSYDGELIKIHWLARVRLRYGPPGNTQEVVREAEFLLAPPSRP
jgi:hypothetical protein